MGPPPIWRASPEAIYLSSGDHATAWTGRPPLELWVKSKVPLAASRMPTVLLALAYATRLLSGDHASASIGSTLGSRGSLRVGDKSSACFWGKCAWCCGGSRRKYQWMGRPLYHAFAASQQKVGEQEDRYLYKQISHRQHLVSLFWLFFRPSLYLRMPSQAKPSLGELLIYRSLAHEIMVLTRVHMPGCSALLLVIRASVAGALPGTQ